MALRRKVNMAQLEIPTGNAIGETHDPDAAFERECGPDRAERERLACASTAPNRWGARNGHKPPCPRAGKRF